MHAERLNFFSQQLFILFLHGLSRELFTRLVETMFYPQQAGLNDGAIGEALK
jgi:hypothetical protein